MCVKDRKRELEIGRYRGGNRQNHMKKMNHYVSIAVRELDRERGREGERYREKESGEEVRVMERDFMYREGINKTI